MNDSRTAIQAVQLSKAFAGRAVLDGLDLEIAAGETAALVGANGAGKTTLLACLASVLRPDSGEVRWFGWPVGRDLALHRSIGVVAHESGLYSHLTLRENLVFAARMSGVGNASRRAERWLKLIGLASHAEALPSRLSRGMRQRMAVARSLIHDPPILLLDEPFTSLDTAGSEWLIALLGDLRDRGRTICFVTHEQEKARQLADRVLELREGRIRDVTARQDLQHPVIRAA